MKSRSTRPEQVLPWVGAVVSATAIVGGRLASILFLAGPHGKDRARAGARAEAVARRRWRGVSRWLMPALARHGSTAAPGQIGHLPASTVERRPLLESNSVTRGWESGKSRRRRVVPRQPAGAVSLGQ